MRKLAEDVQVGDTILLWSVFGTPRRINTIEPYVGTLPASETVGWRTATWKAEPSANQREGGVTLIPGEWWEVVAQ